MHIAREICTSGRLVGGAHRRGDPCLPSPRFFFALFGTFMREHELNSRFSGMVFYLLGVACASSMGTLPGMRPARLDTTRPRSRMHITPHHAPASGYNPERQKFPEA